jgi:hypothetical protein
MKTSPVWYKYDLSNEKQFVLCIKKLEFMVRKSFSYDKWQKRTKYPVSQCPICSDSFEFVKPETHHHPKTLFDIVEGVLQKHIDLNDIDDFTDFQICEEIMELHFAKKIGYIVLCKHCHEKYHDNVPDVLDLIDDAQREQLKTINDFYTKPMKGNSDGRNTDEADAGERSG